MTDSQELRESRSAYLLDGRRVTIGDLIDNDLLAAGSELRFKRPRAGQTRKAVITQAGTVSLDGGQEFRSPWAGTATSRRSLLR
jgi:Restriction Enzyme Adenine Methylase Associated